MSNTKWSGTQRSLRSHLGRRAFRDGEPPPSPAAQLRASARSTRRQSLGLQPARSLISGAASAASSFSRSTCQGRSSGVRRHHDFRVHLDNGYETVAYISGRVKKNRIRILAGERFTLEMTSYDLSKGRINFRRKEEPGTAAWRSFRRRQNKGRVPRWRARAEIRRAVSSVSHPSRTLANGPHASQRLGRRCNDRRSISLS